MGTAAVESKGWFERNARISAQEVVVFVRRAYERLAHPEREYTVAYVDTQVRMRDVVEFAKWHTDQESSKHFVPPLTDAKDIENYYLHSQDKMFFVARNVYDEPLAISALLRKNPYLRGANRRIAYTEKTIVDPKKRRKNIGTTLRATVNDYIFKPDGNGRPRFDEAQLYIMTDDDAGDWRTNFKFFTEKLGYVVNKKHPQWRGYAQDVWGLENERQAFLLVLTDGMWERQKQKNPKLHSAELKLVA